MLHKRGFSLLEVMLALVIVGIGISIILSYSSSNQRHSTSQGNGNTNSVIANAVLQQYLSDIKTCNSCSNGNACCPLTVLLPNTSTVYDYLCSQDSSRQSQTRSIPSFCNTSSSAYTNLVNIGVDIKKITLDLSSAESDM